MNLTQQKALEIDIQNLMTLRSSYMNYIIALTGGTAGLLLLKKSVLILFLITAGIVLDVLFLKKARECSKDIYLKTKEIQKSGK